MKQLLTALAVMLSVVFVAQNASAADVPIGTVATPKVIYIGPSDFDSVTTPPHPLSWSDFSSSCTIPANWLKVGKRIRIRCGGFWSTHNGENVTVKLSVMLGNCQPGVTPDFYLQPAGQGENAWFMQCDLVPYNYGNNYFLKSYGTATFSSNIYFSSPYRYDETYAFDGETLGLIDTTVDNTLRVCARLEKEMELVLENMTVEVLD